MTAAPAVNPFREGLRMERTPEPCVTVIFGASGDLTRRKLMPALYNLAREHLLPPGFSVVGFSRSEMNDDGFRGAMKSAVEQFGEEQVDGQGWRDFSSGLYYLAAHPGKPEDYARLSGTLSKVDQQRHTGGNRLFYLAVPPSAILGIAERLQAAGLAQSSPGWTRIIVEKPFGRDLESARLLNRELGKVFREDQIYRIDHYLGKETVQNLMVFRFSNGIFEPIWNRRYVDQVQITASETIGVENRAAFYEEAGALRDVVQNHVLQVLSITAMEPPVTFEADAVRSERVKALHSIRQIPENEVNQFVVRGQYGPGWVDGHEVVGYRSEPGVNPESQTETFVAMKLYLDNWRWAGVPFYLRAGKRLSKRITEIAIQFKQAPLRLFERASPDGIEPNLLLLRIQPDEGISLRFGAKLPGPAVHVRPVNMDFRYATSFGIASASAYERLLLDCMLGDATLFARNDAVEAAWSAVTPILQAWSKGPPASLPNYAAGTWGPPDAERLLESGDWRAL